MPKLIQIRETVTACRECVYWQTQWEGVFQYSRCMKEDRDIDDARTLPAWCPLPDAPLTPAQVRAAAVQILETAEAERREEPVERRCGTCRWWKICDYTVEGNSVGGCLVPLAEWIEFSEDCMSQMGESDGARCPTWAAKEEE